MLSTSTPDARGWPRPLLDRAYAQTCVLDRERGVPAVEDESFDCVTIGFLANVTDKGGRARFDAPLLKPGGRLLRARVLESGLPGLKPIYDVYSFSVLPWLGKRVPGTLDSYQYLAESIRRFPDQRRCWR